MASKSFSSYFLTNLLGPALLCSASCRQSSDNRPSLQATPAQNLAVATESAPRQETVVSPQWVKALLEFHAPGSTSPRPPTYRNNHFVILEASWAKPENAKDYLAGHIPGAIHFNTDNFETRYPRWLLRRPEELHRTIGAF